MHRKTLLASTLALMIAGSTSFVMAQNMPAPPPPATQAMAGKNMMPSAHGDRGHDMHKNHHDHERGGVIGDLRGLERLYLQSGRSKDMTAVYNDVLTKSQDPRVRDYVYRRLARLQAQPANVDQAIATLRKGLDENLANEAKMRAEHEKMRADWKQRTDKAAPPPAQ
jgi:Spy/CpxP family protein refolding chaperone